MYRWLAEKLGNVSVNRKLGVGFGLVLLLTLLITFTGWTGLSGVMSRGDKLGFIASLNDLTKDLRLARLDYEMRRGEQGPGAVNDLLGQLDTGLKTARTLIEQPADVAMIDQQLAAVSEYKQAFTAMTQAGATREDARSKLGATADNAVARVAEVEKSMLQGDSVADFNSVIDLSKLIQQARFQVRGYTYSGKTEAEQPALDAIDNALKNLESLPSKLPEQHIANLQQATDSLKAYRAAVSQFRDSQVASAAALKRMAVTRRHPARRQQKTHRVANHRPRHRRRARQKPAAAGHRPGAGLRHACRVGHHSPDRDSAEPDPQSGGARCCRRPDSKP